MKELFRILWTETGWPRLTTAERAKAAYFGLSLLALPIFAAVSPWGVLLLVANLGIAAKIVGTIRGIYDE